MLNEQIRPQQVEENSILMPVVVGVCVMVLAVAFYSQSAFELGRLWLAWPVASGSCGRDGALHQANDRVAVCRFVSGCIDDKFSG